MFRYVTLENGRRILEVHSGTGSPDDARTWLRAEVDAEGQPYLYRDGSGEEVTVGVTHAGSVLVRLAGVHVALPPERAQELAALLELAVPDAEKRKAEFAQEIARASAAADS